MSRNKETPEEFNVRAAVLYHEVQDLMRKADVVNRGCCNGCYNGGVWNTVRTLMAMELGDSDFEDRRRTRSRRRMKPYHIEIKVNSRLWLRGRLWRRYWKNYRTEADRDKALTTLNSKEGRTGRKPPLFEYRAAGTGEGQDGVS